MTNIHPMVTQLHFARASFMACVEGIPQEDAKKRINNMNCLSWSVGHLANQEHRYWVQMGLGENLYPELNDLVGYGRPASTPNLDEMLAVWQAVTQRADQFLASLTSAKLETFYERNGKPVAESIGTMLYRNIYHYWYHTGEMRTIREMLGHTNLPEYVGDMSHATYRHENDWG